MKIENNNNLSISVEQYKGTDIYKGIYNDNLEKNLEKGFSETPEATDNEKPKPPTVEETHADELKAKQLKQEISQKMDKKHSYDKMSNEEKRALRILINIDGKSAKEKIESVMEHFGVSKMGAINILADATNHLKETMPDEGEEGGKAPVDEKKEKELNKAFGIDDDYLEKGRGLPIGTINKYGEVKTADGWKHIKKGQRSSSHDAAIAHSKKTGEHVIPEHDLHPDKGTKKSPMGRSLTTEEATGVHRNMPVRSMFESNKEYRDALDKYHKGDSKEESDAREKDASVKSILKDATPEKYKGDFSKLEKEVFEAGGSKSDSYLQEILESKKEEFKGYHESKKEDTKGGEGFSKGKTYSPKSNIEVLSFSGNKQVKLSPSDKLQYTGQVIPLKGEPHHILSGSNKKVAIPVSELDSMSSRFSEGGAKKPVSEMSSKELEEASGLGALGLQDISGYKEWQSLKEQQSKPGASKGLDVNTAQAFKKYRDNLRKYVEKRGGEGAKKGEPKSTGAVSKSK